MISTSIEFRTGILSVALCVLYSVSCSCILFADERSTDVVIYDATPAGIAAAVAAAESECDVLLMEPSSRIGGMMTGGLSHPDFKTFESLTGAFLDFTIQVQQHYEETYGADSQQAKDCFRGTHGEPKVNLQVFHEMLREHPRIKLLHGHRIVDTETRSEGDQRRIVSAGFSDADGKRLTVNAQLFIDAGYEGDLMAAAGVEYRIGREARSTYGEPLAPEKADDQLQGYNFRLILTKEAKNRVMPSAPIGYEREMFTDVIPLLKSGEIKTAFARWRDCLFKAHTPILPNGKYDINDVSQSPVRSSLPQINDGWPEGDRETRERIFQQHMRHNVGLLYFLQNDQAVPDKFRDEARQWGLCADEFLDTNHLSSELYVREARRMQGVTVYTQNDTADAEGDARTVLHTDSIAMGDYGHSSHGTAHEGPLFGGKHTGAFHQGRRPYQVPYGVIIPKDCVNLLVPTACSASHIGFCALRLEPTWMNMGQAAGVAAGIALQEDRSVQDVSVKAIQRQLHRKGAATIYVSDVPADNENFEVVQWWGTLGGWHDIELRPSGSPTGPEIRDHYYQAFQGHQAQLDTTLDTDTRDCWLAILSQLGLDSAEFGEAKSRGEFIRLAYQRSGKTQSHEEVGEFSIPDVSPLGDAQLAKLRELVKTDSEAAELADSVRKQAMRLLETPPRPIAVIHYEGLVNTDPKRIQSVEHLKQLSEIAVLMRHWQATGDDRAAATLRSMIAAWAETYQPTGNDVNENKFYPLLVAYLALQESFDASQRKRINAWVDQLGRLHERAVTTSRKFSNRYSKSVRLLAIAGMVLDRDEWAQTANEGVKRFVGESLYHDGSSRDLKHRDSLTYHGSSLKPPMELAMLAGEEGLDLYSWTSPKSGSLKNSVDFMVPYAMGEKTHEEWVNTKVELDRRRAAAGLEKYRAGRLYEPKDALEVMEYASYFDPDLMRVVRHLTKSEARRFPTWRTLVNEAGRP